MNAEKNSYREVDENSDDDSEREKNSEHSSDEEESADVLDAPTEDLDEVRRYLAAKLGISVPGRGDDDQRQPAILESFDLKGIANYILSGKGKNIVVMAGAGISTSAGIPDFRTPGTGLYSNLEKYNLPRPEAIFDIGFFKENPKPFFYLAKELYPGKFSPTLSHFFIKLLEVKGLLLRHYTQNIDTLEREAGVSDDKLVEAHGAFHTAHCIACSKEFSKEWVKEKVFSDTIPHCTKENCRGIVKPDIVFFGESLPERFFRCTRTDFRACDLLIILGTSLVVQPFASLINMVGEECPRLLINREKVGEASRLEDIICGGGLHFSDSGGYRDVAYLGSCDAGCGELAKLLGWEEDLKSIMEGYQGEGWGATASL